MTFQTTTVPANGTVFAPLSNKWTSDPTLQARLQFDGAIGCFSFATGSNDLQFGFQQGIIAGNAANGDGIFSYGASKQSILMQILYRDTSATSGYVSSMANNVFTLIAQGSTSAGNATVNIITINGQGLCLGYDGSIIQSDPSRWFGFNFAPNGSISGMFTYNGFPSGPITSNICAMWGENYNFQPTLQVEPILQFVTKTNGATWTALQTMDMGQCCSTGFSSDGEKSVCSLLGLAAGTSAACTSFMTAPTTGFCVSDPTLASCVAYCSGTTVDCDSLYQTYCDKLSAADAFATKECGCFLSAAFKANYDASLIAAGLGVLAAQSDYCRLEKCAQSNVLPVLTKANKTCTSLVVCVSSITVDNNGAIGPLTAQQSQNCGNGGTGTGTGTGVQTQTPLFSFLPVSLFGLTQTMYLSIAALVVVVVVVLLLLSLHPKKKARK